MSEITVKKRGRPEGSTNDAYKAFQYAMREVISEHDKSNPKELRISAKELVYQLIQERNPAIIKKFVDYHVDVENTLKNHALVEKLKIETELMQKRFEQESRIRELEIALKEKELALIANPSVTNELLIAQLAEERNKVRAKLNQQADAQVDD